MNFNNIFSPNHFVVCK